MKPVVKLRMGRPHKVVPTVPAQRLPYGRAWLAFQFARLTFTSGVEIGTWRGEYAELLCVMNPDLRLRCVDPWMWYPDYRKQQREKADDYLEQAYQVASDRLGRIGQVTLCRQLSVDAAAEVPDRSLDFVYIDGNHAESFVRADLEAWAPKVRVGGIVAGHDYVSSGHRYKRVKPAVDAFVTDHGITEWYVLAGDLKPSFFWHVR